MSLSTVLDATPVTHKRQLVAWFESACKPPQRFLIGTEHEKFMVDKFSHHPIPYEGPNGLHIFLDEMRAFKWQPIEQEGVLVGLKRGQAVITYEPGGQLELSGAPFPTLHETAAELHHHLDEVSSVARVMNLTALGMGFHPKAKREEVPWMPKPRYKIMREYMPKKGSLGLDMMLRTATVQVNLDYADERDMAKKFRVGMALQPIVAALFASSPFRDGRLSGDLSFRNRVWQHTDPDRCTYMEFVFHPNFGFEHYVDYALSVPMYFAIRDGRHIDLTGASFRDFMQGHLEQLPGEVPTMADWANHLSTLFPPVRLKNIIEMRGADMGTPEMTLALPALWTGLLYDSMCLDAADDLTRRWTAADRVAMYQNVPRLGMDTPLLGRTVREMAKEVVGIAEVGLKRRKRFNDYGEDESLYLEVLRRILTRGTTTAEELVRLYCDEWGENVDPVFEACRIA